MLNVCKSRNRRNLLSLSLLAILWIFYGKITEMALQIKVEVPISVDTRNKLKSIDRYWLFLEKICE